MRAGALALLVATTAFGSEAAKLSSGTYVSREGTVELKPVAGGKMPFDIETASAIADLCSAVGTIDVATDAVTVADAPGCVLKITVIPNGVRVDPQAGCDGLCGRTASLDGDYVVKPDACKKVDATKSSFKKLYDAKKYAEAAALYDGYLQTCEPLTGLNTLNGIYNDLAIAKFHVGDYASCIKLSKTVEETGNPELPRWAELYGTDAKAAAFNRKKCEKAAAQTKGKAKAKPRR
jgi:hypothetical protein